MAYLGTPIDTQNQFQSLQGKRFSGDGSTTAFTLDIAPSSVFDIEVFVENVRQDPNSAYGISGTTLTFTGAPPSGTNNIYVVHQAKAVGTIDVPASGVVPASLASNIISGQTELAATPADTDEFLISDAGTVKRIDFSHIKGVVRQVVSTFKDSAFTSSSTSLTDVTGLSVAITPSSTSSKVLIMLSCGISPGTGGHNIHLALLRGSTAIGDSDFGSNIDTFAFTNQGANSDVVTVGQHFVDSPSSVSEQTYKIQMSVSSGTGAIGRRADADSRGMGASLTAMEILG